MSILRFIEVFDHLACRFLLLVGMKNEEEQILLQFPEDLYYFKRIHL